MSESYKKAFTTQSLGLPSLLVHYFGFQKCLPLHFWQGKRDHFLLHYILSGKGVYIVDEKTYNLSEGDFFLARIGEEVFFQADEFDPWEYCWVGFNGSEVPYILSNTDFKNTKNHLVHQNSHDEEIKEIFDNFFKHTGNTLADVMRMTSGLYLIFSILIEEKSKALQLQGKNYDLLIEISEYIEKNLSNTNLSVKNICQKFGLSPSTLYRMFVKETALSPIEYIIEHRMKCACILMRSEKQSISEIAYKVGYNDPLYFSKHFKKIFKLSPTSFVQKYANQKDLDIEVFRPVIK